MVAPDKILELVDRFSYNYSSYRSVRYNETQVRREFIDPMFRTLGWDIDNENGYAEAYKEVVHEDAIKIGGQTKAPDYSFRVGGTRKFFLEAKKPSVNVRDDLPPAFQLRRYAWSAKLPLSILTDFEELAVYDCRLKPNLTDRASTARVQYLTFREYADRWDDIVSVFSREAILKGSFDKYANDTKSKRGTAEVDNSFLKELESWRELLAKNIALRNPALTQRELKTAVQKTIDRIIFLRICEDRGIEPYDTLGSLQKGSGIYARLGYLFQRADDRYNSGLFHFKQERNRPEAADTFTLGLKIDDKPLKEILKGLYYPNSPYEFSVLPADILGQVYEQFLGKVIVLDAKHKATVEEKPEVKKAGGVYYTPTYIVEYIVQNTVGKLLEGKTPNQISDVGKTPPLRVLDPACGSGSFLIGAYQYLLDWHLTWYSENDPEKYAKGRSPRLYQGKAQGWRLTTDERKRILLTHIYGVDIDAQAVEVTKLSLLLKMLEGENNDSLNAQSALFQKRVLPDLETNIKSGNSLIGSDFYDSVQINLFDEEERYRINVFDWEDEFAQVFADGGFDAVIGNPPYIRIQALKEFAPKEVEFYKTKYQAAGKGNYDIYVVFVERSLQLLNQRGKLGFILPHKFFNAKYGEPVREVITQGNHLAEIVHFSDEQVFKNATTYTCLLFLEATARDEFTFRGADDLAEWRLNKTAKEGTVSASKATGEEWNFSTGREADLYHKLLAVPTKLGSFTNIFVGLQTSADTVFLFKNSIKSGYELTTVHSKELDKEVQIENALLKPVIRSGSIGQFQASPTALVLFPYERRGESLKLISEERMASSFPKAWAYLSKNKSLLENREKGKFKASGWYQLYPKNLDVWEQEKLMMPYMVTKLSGFLDRENSYFVNVTTGGFGITLKQDLCSLAYLSGLLNSSLLDWFFRAVTTNFNSGYFAANKQYLVQLPIHIDKREADYLRVEQLSTALHSMNVQLKAAKTGQDRKPLERQIKAAERQINQLVYKLYDLTPKEITLVEGS